MKKLLISAIMIGFVIAMVTLGITEDKKSQDKNEVQIKIEKLIQQLGSDNFQQRESAQKELTEYSEKLMEQYKNLKKSGDKIKELVGVKSEIEKFAQLIQNACQDKDPEIKNRVNQIRQHLYSLTQPKIAFVSLRDGNSQIYIMDADGKNQTRLTENKAPDNSPAWSPDGKRIAFASLRDGNSQIYVMDADGTNQTRLTQTKRGDFSPAWSPDGKRIAFASSRDGSNEIYVMDSDGKNQIRLTENKAEDWSPTWSTILLPELSALFTLRDEGFAPLNEKDKK